MDIEDTDDAELQTTKMWLAASGRVLAGCAMSVSRSASVRNPT